MRSSSIWIIGSVLKCCLQSVCITATEVQHRNWPIFPFSFPFFSYPSLFVSMFAYMRSIAKTKAVDRIYVPSSKIRFCCGCGRFFPIGVIAIICLFLRLSPLLPILALYIHTVRIGSSVPRYTWIDISNSWQSHENYIPLFFFGKGSPDWRNGLSSWQAIHTY